MTTSPPPPPPPSNKPPLMPPPPAAPHKANPNGFLEGLVKQAKPSADPGFIWLILGVEGWGKTSLGAYIPDVLFVSGGVETGYQTLLNVGRVPEVPHAHVDEWVELKGLTREWAVAKGGVPKHAVFDCLGSMSAMCFEHVLRTQFGGSRDAYKDSFGMGHRSYGDEWVSFLACLEEAKKRGRTSVLLAHTEQKTVTQPAVGTYDRMMANLDKQVIGSTYRVCDEVIFGNFLADIKGKKGSDAKGKAVEGGGTQRVAYTERCDAWDAKNRLGLPPFLVMPNNPADVWPMLTSHITKGT